MPKKSQSLFQKIETVFTILAITHYTADWVPLIASGGASEGDGSVYPTNLAMNTALYFLTYLGAIFFLILRWKKTLYFMSKDRIIITIVGFAVASITWSDEPSITIRTAITLIGTTFFGLYLGSRYSIQEQVRILGWTYLFILILSLLFIGGLPHYGIMGAIHSGAFRGIFTHKNLFGRFLALSMIVFLMFKTVLPQKKTWIAHCCIGLVLILLPGVRSTTSMINTSILLMALLAYQTFRFRYVLMVPAFLSLVTLSGVLYFLYTEYSSLVFASLGKDASLTGRTDLWMYAWDMIEKKFWLGYGWGAFWRGLDGPSGYIIRIAQWPVPNSHNGWIDLWLDLGFVGVLTYALGFLINLIRSLWLARSTNALYGLWPLIYLTYTLISTYTETGLVARNSIFWLLYIAISITIAEPDIKENYRVQHEVLESKP
ncbi:O-antigen polymerase [Planktothrix serta PCC 8927]|uniref:O-antigen polymerase n=1 Tax=Planktothrix serta PCC 8927 TaxID=671068 RepID=A0A7Z9BRZ4_9CYAN|nr:O-antigen ligase [Planktothrix serta]VXD15814.1 O-antigen polymerase [Planktothrix serta PCC 8927]